MLKQSITYTDPFTGQPRTEDFYFNLTKAEITEMEVRANLRGGLSKMLQEVVDSNDGNLIMDRFRDIIGKSYGIRTEDGHFRKSPEISAVFLASEPYSELFMDIVTDANKASAFINGIVPADLSQPGVNVAGRPATQDHQQSQPQPFTPPPLPQVYPAQAADPQQVAQNIFNRPQHESGPGYEVPPQQ